MQKLFPFLFFYPQTSFQNRNMDKAQAKNFDRVVNKDRIIVAELFVCFVRRIFIMTMFISTIYFL